MPNKIINKVKFDSDVSVMEKVKISDVCKISNGYAFKSAKYTTGNGARVIRITNVQKSKIVDNDPKIYPSSELSNLDNYKIFEGDILMSLTGNVGRVGKFPKEMLPAYINQRVCRIMPTNDKLDINYLFNFLNSDIFENDAIRNSAGAAQLNLSTNWLAEYEIPLPPLETQQKIAAILDKADELRQYSKQLIEKYEALTQSLFLDMFGDPVRNEKGWEKSKLGDFGKVVTGSTPSRNEQDNFSSKHIEWIKTDNIDAGQIYVTKSSEYLSEKGLSKGRFVEKDALLVACIAGSIESIGRASLTDRKVSFNQQINAIQPNENVQPNFLYHLFKSTKKHIQNHASNGMKRMLSKGEFEKILMIIPPISLQNQFAERVQQIELQKQQAQEALEKSEALFQGLLQQAFKGELN